jgi:hypothetical protein
MEKDIRFWMLLSELNSLTTVLSIKCPEYQERVSKLKGELTEMILKGLEESKKFKETQIDNWYVRNN